MTQNSNFGKICSLIDGYGAIVVELQEKLVSIPALAPESEGQGESEKAEYVKTLLDQLKLDNIKEFNAPDNRVSPPYRPNILARLNGVVRDRTVWILAHLDVVPPGDLKLWQGDPFKLKVDGDRLIGRGVEDNHQGLVSALLAIKAFKEAGIMPKNNIGLAIVADEENGSQYGLQYLIKNHKQKFNKNDLFIVPDAGDARGRLVEIAEKSILWIKFRIQGKQCHASTPELGINAHRVAANLAVMLDELNKIFGEKDQIFEPPVSTFEPTKKEANVPNINTIPGEDIFYLDCRILPRYPLDKVEAKIKEMVYAVEKEHKVKIEISYSQKAEAAPPTPEDAPVVRALERAVKDVKGIDVKRIGIGGGTVAAFFRNEGFYAAVWSTLEDTAHQPNESSLISNTLSDAKVMAHIFLMA